MENKWIVEGYLGKYARGGISKTGNKWYGNSISVTDGRDKETGMFKKIYVGFTLFGDDVNITEQFGDSTIVRLTGVPEINTYTNKQGEQVSTLQVRFAKVEIVTEGNSRGDTSFTPDDLASYESDLPF